MSPERKKKVSSDQPNLLRLFKQCHSAYYVLRLVNLVSRTLPPLSLSIIHLQQVSPFHSHFIMTQSWDGNERERPEMERQFSSLIFLRRSFISSFWAPPHLPPSAVAASVCVWVWSYKLHIIEGWCVIISIIIFIQSQVPGDSCPTGFARFLATPLLTHHERVDLMDTFGLHTWTHFNKGEKTVRVSGVTVK